MKAAIIATILSMFGAAAYLAAADNDTPQATSALAHKVADWQMAHPSRHGTKDWTQAAWYAGMMAVAKLPDGAKYEQAMQKMGEANGWELGKRPLHADDHAVGMTYCELYFKHKNPRMIAPMRAAFDNILAHPPQANLEVRTNKHTRWSWCDALFMAPPAWLRLYVATNDARYLDYMNQEFWATTNYLYDKEENLFYRDSSFFALRETNGKKVFWSRGNGWVVAGLARIIPYLPKNFRDKPRYEKLFQELCAKLVAIQQADGLWRSSLLDPQYHALPEASGSGFFCFALAWGINNGLLPRDKYAAPTLKAWNALTKLVAPDGKVTCVQPIGAEPGKYAADSTEVYGCGAFLLAAAEIYTMQQQDRNAR